MKFFHLSDLHIGLKLLGHDLLEDQKYILDEIIELAKEHHPDAVVIAGDIYDRAVPSVEAVRLFDGFLTALSAALPEAELMIISGNHDSPPRIDMFRSILQSHRIHMIGLPPQTEGERIEKAVLRDAFGEVNFYLLPFVKPSMVRAIVGSDENGNSLSYDKSVRRLLEREAIDLAARNVLVSHQFYLPAGMTGEEVERMDSEVRTVGNIDAIGADAIACFDYAALGHIHKPMKVGSETLRYCGTPLACSVSEAGQEKGVILVELQNKGEVSTTVLPLKPLREVRVLSGDLVDVLREACDDYVRVELTDTTEMDVVDTQDRLRNVFPHLLEVRRTYLRTVNYSAAYLLDDLKSPEDLCREYLGDLDEEELAELRDVINTVMEGME